MWIDSHCHLDHEKIHPLGTPGEIAARAQSAGVSGMLTVCCNITDEFVGLKETAASLGNVWCSVGTHPHDSGDAREHSITAQRLAELALSHPKVIAIGETGLDFYYYNSPAEDQRESFGKHIRACLAADMPVIVHSRDAEEETAAILREEGKGKLRGVMHCFSSGSKLAQVALDLGFYISFSGIVTFAKAKELQEIARTVPLDRILVETDAPYLAPEPHRGKVNEPALLPHTGAFLAALKGISVQEMAKCTTENFFTLFNRATP